MNAPELRRKAAEARTLAGTARDPAIHALLLELAADLETEADSQDGDPLERRAHRRIPVEGPLVQIRRLDRPQVAFLTLADLSEGGAGLRGTLAWQVGTPVELSFLGGRTMLRGRIVRLVGRHVGVAFAAASGAALATAQLVLALSTEDSDS
ncbi:MAG: PilZ domain-containing protein, partial [Rhodospirillales bacterium]|nr:PilZ domain-containing protein [Rhodospirillales bacterium]